MSRTALIAIALALTVVAHIMVVLTLDGGPTDSTVATRERPAVRSLQGTSGGAISESQAPSGEATARRIASLEADIERLEAELASAQVVLAEQAAERTLLEAKASAAPDNPLLDIVRKMGGQEETEGEGGKSGNFMSSLASIYEGESGRNMARQSARMAVDMAYGDFVAEAGLPRDIEEQVRALMVENMADDIVEGVRLASGDKPDYQEVEKRKEEAKAQLREHLAEILDDAQLAQWDAYEETVTSRMLQRQYDMQMSMFAPKLSLETRQLVAQTLADEMSVAQKEMAQAPGTAFDGGISMQQRAFERARAWLFGQLPEEDYTEADRFITQMEDMTRAAMRMMGMSEEPESGEAAE